MSKQKRRYRSYAPSDNEYIVKGERRAPNYSPTVSPNQGEWGIEQQQQDDQLAQQQEIAEQQEQQKQEQERKRFQDYVPEFDTPDTGIPLLDDIYTLSKGVLSDIAGGVGAGFGVDLPRGLAGVSDMANQMLEETDVERTALGAATGFFTGGGIPGALLGGATAFGSGELGKELTEVATPVFRDVSKTMQEILPKEGKTSQFAYDLGRGGTSIVTTMVASGLGGLVGGPAGAIGGGLASAFALEGGTAYEDALEYTGDRKTALKVGVVVGGINTALEFFGVNKIMKAFTKSGGEVVKKGLTKYLSGVLRETSEAALVEGATEFAQESVNVLAENIYRDAKDQTTVSEWLDRSGYAALLGAVLGGGFGGGGKTLSNIQEVKSNLNSFQNAMEDAKTTEDKLPEQKPLENPFAKQEQEQQEQQQEQEVAPQEDIEKPTLKIEEEIEPLAETREPKTPTEPAPRTMPQEEEVSGSMKFKKAVRYGEDIVTGETIVEAKEKLAKKLGYKNVKSLDTDIIAGIDEGTVNESGEFVRKGGTKPVTQTVEEQLPETKDGPKTKSDMETYIKTLEGDKESVKRWNKFEKEDKAYAKAVENTVGDMVTEEGKPIRKIKQGEYKDTYGNEVPEVHRPIFDMVADNEAFEDASVEFRQDVTGVIDRKDMINLYGVDPAEHPGLYTEIGEQDADYDKKKENYRVPLGGKYTIEKVGDTNARRIVVNENVSEEHFLEEAIHHIQNKAEKIDNEFAEQLRDFEIEVRDRASKAGFNVPAGQELLPKLFVYQSLYKNDPEFAEVEEFLTIPDKIYETIVDKIATTSKQKRQLQDLISKVAGKPEAKEQAAFIPKGNENVQQKVFKKISGDTLLKWGKDIQQRILNPSAQPDYKNMVDPGKPFSETSKPVETFQKAATAFVTAQHLGGDQKKLDAGVNDIMNGQETSDAAIEVRNIIQTGLESGYSAEFEGIGEVSFTPKEFELLVAEQVRNMQALENDNVERSEMFSVIKPGSETAKMIEDIKSKADGLQYGAKTTTTVRSDIESRVRQIKAGYKDAVKEGKKKAGEIKKLKSQLIGYTNDILPRLDAKKSEVLRLMRQVRDVETVEELEQAYERVREVETNMDKRKMRDVINKYLKTKPTKASGKKKATRLSDIGYKIVGIAREVANSKVQDNNMEIIEKLSNKEDLTEAEIEEYNNRIYIEKLFRNLDLGKKKVTPTSEFTRYQMAMRFLEGIHSVESERFKQKKLAEAKRKSQQNEEIIKTILGDEKFDDKKRVERENSTWEKIKRAVNNNINSLSSLEYLFDFISNDKSDPLDSFINKTFVKKLHRAGNLEASIMMRASEDATRAWMQAHGYLDDNGNIPPGKGKWLMRIKAKVKHKLEDGKKQIDSGIDYEKVRYVSRNDVNKAKAGLKNPKIEDVGKKLSKITTKERMVISRNEARYYYLLSQDPNARAQLERNGITEDVLDALKSKVLTKADIRYAEWEIGYYRQFGGFINDVFKRMQGVDIDMYDVYVPYSREVSGNQMDDLSSGMDKKHPLNTVTSGHLKSRVTNNVAFKQTDATDLFINYINQMSHYVAWAETHRDLYNTFNDKDVKRAIKDMHGARPQKAIMKFIEDIAAGGQQNVYMNKIFDKLRANFVTYGVGANLTVWVKQMTSIAAYWNDVDSKYYAKALANLAKNPNAVYKDLKRMWEGSDFLRSRYKQGFTRDQVVAFGKSLSRAGRVKDTLTRSFYIFTKAGDVSAIVLGSYPAYLQERAKVAGENISDKEKHERAMENVEIITDRAQQSGRLYQLGELQRGSGLGRWFTMFMNSLIQYNRAGIAAVRNLARGRGSKTKNIKTIFNTWVVLPTLFQYVASAFEWDDEDMMLAILTSPLAGIPVFGTALRGALFGFDASISPVIDSIEDLTQTFPRVAKQLYKYANGEISIQELLDSSEDFMKAIAATRGIPLSNTNRIVSGIYDTINGRTDNPIRRSMGFSKYVLGETESGKRRALIEELGNPWEGKEFEGDSVAADNNLPYLSGYATIGGEKVEFDADEYRQYIGIYKKHLNRRVKRYKKDKGYSADQLHRDAMAAAKQEFFKRTKNKKKWRGWE